MLSRSNTKVLMEVEPNTNFNKKVEFSLCSKAVSIGFISGYDDGTFRPADNVTYEQAITMRCV